MMQSKPTSSEQQAVTKSERMNENPESNVFSSMMNEASQQKDSEGENTHEVGSQSKETESVDKQLVEQKGLDDALIYVNAEKELTEINVPFDSLHYLLSKYGMDSKAQLSNQMLNNQGFNGENSSLFDQLSLSDLTAANLEEALNVNELAVDEELVEQLLTELSIVLQQIQQLLNQGGKEVELAQTAKHIQKLLQLWTKMPKQMQQSLTQNELNLEAEGEESEILRNLISLFEKRNSFAKQNVYQMNASITEEDVQKWLQQALEKYSEPHTERSTTTVTNQQPIQMSHIQQYTLHVTDSERIDAISRNLVSDLNEIMNRSQFLKRPGIEQLTLTLRPQSLGDVTIRLAQVNGEITVRFLVTTHAARELFESNLNQLKPMFAPNNVVIERDAGISDEEFYQEDQEQLEEEKDQTDHEHESDQDETTQNEISFEELLQALGKESES